MSKAATAVWITALMKRLCGSFHEWTRNKSIALFHYTHIITHALHSSMPYTRSGKQTNTHTHTPTHPLSVCAGACRGSRRRAPSLLCSPGPSANKQTGKSTA